MSLKDIADEVGTSVSTVSRVLSGKTGATNEPDLYEKIWEAARKQNYKVNDVARKLRTGDSQEEADYRVDIFLTRFDYLESDPFFKEIYDFLRNEITRAGCVMGDILSYEDIISFGTSKKGEGHIPYKSTAAVEYHRNTNALSGVKHIDNCGLIILGKCPQNLINTLKQRYSQIVGIDRNPTEFLYDEVFCNGSGAAQRAMEYLISLNHRDIAYVGDCSYEARYAGYYQALMNHHIPLRHEYIFPTDQSRKAGVEVAAKILEVNSRPTAIFCANDATALGLIEGFRKLRKRSYKPSIISIDNIAESERSNPMLTTIDIPKEEMSHLAFGLLMDRRKDKNRKNARIELPFQLIVRDSCQRN